MIPVEPVRVMPAKGEVKLHYHGYFIHLVNLMLVAKLQTMQKFILGALIVLPYLLSAQSDSALRNEDSLRRSALYLEPVEVRAIRASENSPFAKTTITGKEIKKTNLGSGPSVPAQSNSICCN
jgi:hypothetical protein